MWHKMVNYDMTCRTLYVNTNLWTIMPYDMLNIYETHMYGASHGYVVIFIYITLMQKHLRSLKKGSRSLVGIAISKIISKIIWQKRTL